MDNMDNKNNFNEEFQNRKKGKSQKLAFLVSSIALLAICFCASYFITDYLTSNNRGKVEEENKTVYSETNKYLKDSTYITLKTGDNIDVSEELLSLKGKIGLSGNITKDDLADKLKKEGYEILKDEEGKMVFSRSVAEGVKLESNKYYLGEESGFITLFKTDENGEILENEKKVYSQSKPLSGLPEEDQKNIRENKFSYNTREEALMKLSEMIS
ncbi:hypothetical protein JCM1393_29410 [Clostridium carnis]